MSLTPSSPAVARQPRCCARFDPAPWRDTRVSWDAKPFVKVHVRSAFHVPLGLRSVFQKQQAAIERAGMRSSDPFVLTDELGPFGADYYFPTSGPVPDADMTSVHGEFAVEVYSGGYRELGKWTRELHARIRARGRRIDKLYFWYTTCPSCARAYSANYVVAFIRVV